jgi:RND family efflux transporter MFP subunit
VAVEVEIVAPAPVTRSIEVVGTLAPRFETEVKSELPGRLTAVQVTQWIPVEKGQALARVDTLELEAGLDRARAAVTAGAAAESAARAGLLETRVAAEQAEREYERLRKLKEAGLSTQQSLDGGLSARDAARARIEAAEAQIESARAQTLAARQEVRQLETRLAKAVIRAPLSGVVSERLANVGDLPGDKPLFRIVDNRLLDLTVTVPSRELASVRPGQRLTFCVDSLPGRSFTGRILHLNPVVDPADRSCRVTAEVRNGDGLLKGGLFVRGRIDTGERRDVLQVRRDALVAWDTAAGKAELFVVEGGSARRRQVVTGAAAGDRVEVSSGLAAGEAVVTRGGFNLKDGARVSAAPGGKKV